MRSLLISLFLTGLSLSNIKAIKILEEDKLAMKVRKGSVQSFTFKNLIFSEGQVFNMNGIIVTDTKTMYFHLAQKMFRK